MDRALETRIVTWRELSAQPDIAENSVATLDKIEKAILRWKPRAPDEAVAVLEVLQENILAGQRTDGADLAAVRNLIRFVKQGLGETRAGVAHEPASWLAS